MSGLPQLLVMGLTEGGLYALVALPIVLVFKSTQVVSLAHGQLLAWGALLFYGFFGLLSSFALPAFILTLIAVGGLAFAIEHITLKPLIGQPLFAAFLVTFGVFFVFDGVFQLILQGSTISLPDFLPRGTLQVKNLELPEGQLLSLVVALVVFGLLGLFFRYTKIGLGMRATAEDHQLAQSAGVSVKEIFSVVWIVSGLVASISGIATANVTDIYFSLPLIGMKGLTVALFGGLDSIPGALLGGIALGTLENLSAGYLDPVVGGGSKEVAAYVMVLVILLVKPYGLFGQVRIERI